MESNELSIGPKLFAFGSLAGSLDAVGKSAAIEFLIPIEIRFALLPSG